MMLVKCLVECLVSSFVDTINSFNKKGSYFS